MSGASDAFGNPLDRPEAGGAALRGGALRAAGFAVGVLLTLASAPLLIRHLGQADFGRYTAVVALVTLVGGVTEGGLNAIALREFATLEGPGRERVIGNLLGLRLGLALLGAAAATLFAAAAGYGGALVLGTALASAGMAVQSLQTLCAMSLQADLRFGWATAADLSRQAVLVALIVAGVLVGADLVAFLAVPIPAALAALVPTLWLVRRRIPIRPRFDPATIWPLLRDALPYTAAVAVSVVYFRLTILIMSVASSAAETGHFATSFRVVEVLAGIPGLAVAAVFPLLARAGRDDAGRFALGVRRVFDLGVVVGAGVALAVLLGAPIAIAVLAGDEGRPAIDVLRIQGLALAATFPANVFGFALLALRRQHAILAINLGALVVTVAVTLALVGGFGARGGAIATVAAELALAVGGGVALVRARPGIGLPLRAAAAVMAIAAVSAAIPLALGLPAIPAVALGLVLYLGGLRVAGRMPPEVGELLGGLRGGRHA